MKKLFKEDFDKLPDEMFETFDYKPIAAASLAQVFRATTKEGQEVAVKVQYRELQNRFDSDFNTIQLIQFFVQMVHKNYDFGWILSKVRDNLESVSIMMFYIDWEIKFHDVSIVYCRNLILISKVEMLKCVPKIWPNLNLFIYQLFFGIILVR